MWRQMLLPAASYTTATISANDFSLVCPVPLQEKSINLSLNLMRENLILLVLDNIAWLIAYSKNLCDALIDTVEKKKISKIYVQT